tara:strand:- start:18878 stop:20614 length:1737 start_codon:yes stop_codon:yes gene_type:complete
MDIQAARQWLKGWWIHPITPALVSLVGIASLPALENRALSLPFAVTVVAAFAAILFAISRRLSFSVCTAWMIVCILTLTSLLKFRLKGFSFHIYDFFFTAMDTEALGFLLFNYPFVVVPIFALLVLFIGLAIVMFRMDRVRSPSAVMRLAPMILLLALLPVTYPPEATAQPRHFYYLLGRHVTAFFVSILDLQYIFGDNELEARLAKLPSGAGFSGISECGQDDRPDIFVVLEESQTNPAYFKQIEKGPQVAASMMLPGEALRPLNVEMFSGGTWITGLSLLTGLSARDFGWRSPYLTVTLEGALRGTIPQILADCGYHTIAQLALNYTFVNEGPFLKSIGFETILDNRAIGAEAETLRDAFYFSKVEELVEGLRPKDNRPLFVYLQTMFTHSLYNARLAPEIMVPGEPFSSNKDLAEYMRRLVISRSDFSDFSRWARANATPRGVVIMSFGDHQPFATLPLVTELEGGNALADPESLAYKTFFTLSRYDGAGENMNIPAESSMTDIGFLGVDLLRAAGIPGSDLYRDLARLKQGCKGLFSQCADRREMDMHLRERIDGGLLDLATDSTVVKPATGSR